MAEEMENDDLQPIAKPRTAKSESVAQDLYFGTVEQSFKESAYHPDSQQRPYNPDPLVRQDYTYGVYEDMMADDQIDVALNLKKELVVGSGWHIQSSEEELTEELTAILQDEPDRPLSEMLQDIIQAYEFGFSVSEKIFKNLSDGRLALKDIRPRHPSTWLLHTDPHGNVIRYEQRAKSMAIDVNPMALIHYVNNQRHQNPYGKSDLYAAYQAWLTKRHVTRFYAIFLENAAGPKPVAKYDRRAPAGVVEDIFNSIKKLQTKTAMVIPKDFELEFLETSNSGDAYIKGINLFNMFIGRALFIPDLLGFSGGETGGGSFSLGKEQIGLFYKHINRRRETLERLIDQHIIRPLCVYNYGMLEHFPKFKFNPLSDEDASKQAELWIKGIQGVGWEPTPEEVNHFRNLVKFPVSDDIIFKADKAAMLAQQAMNGESGAPTDGPKPPPEEAEAEEPEETNEEESESEEPEKKEFALKLDSLPGNYKAKVDFKLADQTLKSVVSKIKAEAQPIVEDIFEDLYDQLQKKRIIQTQNIERMDSIKLKYLGRLQGVFKKHFRNLYGDAKAQAMTEVKKSDFAANIPADEFLNFINQETYKYVGDWEYTITKRTKEALINAIKDGKPLSTVMSVLDDEGKALSEASIERYARTKTTEVFNRGRLDYFNSTGVVAAYQYSAILDDVTSEICGNLHGLVFPKETAPVPPMHFNCRSVLIPITRFEEWSEDRVTNSGQNVDKFIEKNVEDKGFSRYDLEPTPEVEETEETEEPAKEEKPEPDVGHPDVTFDTQYPDAFTEVVTYSFNGQAFKETTIIYKDEAKTDIKSISHRRLNNGEKV